jgi:hypothetical protein
VTSNQEIAKHKMLLELGLFYFKMPKQKKSMSPKIFVAEVLAIFSDIRRRKQPRSFSTT